MTTTLERPNVNGHLTPKVAVGYRRISDPNQPGGSMDTQAAQIMQFVESQGFNFGCMYEDRESGLLETRPGYQRMIQGARDGEFQVVVIPRFDRFGRDDAEYFPRLREV
jgi:site-specific DNA recombinase